MDKTLIRRRFAKAVGQLFHTGRMYSGRLLSHG